MKKINTLFLICGLSVGGAETMLVNLANRFNLEKFNVTVASLDAHNPLAEKIRPGAIKVVAFPRKWRYDLSPAYDLGRLILRENIDKVMVFGTFELVFLRAAFWNLPNPPQVYVSIHSTVWQSPKQRIQHFLYARLLTGSEKIVSVCNAQADYWSKTYLIPRSRFTTVYNGVDVNFFAPQGLTDIRSTVRSQWGIPPDAFVFLKVASFLPYKSHEDAFLALRLTRDALPRALPYLLLVGGGTLERKKILKRRITELGIADSVIFCGIQKDVRPFYRAADVFTLTSSYGESFSVAALEAMAMGLPCVLTNVSGAREMIVEGVNGFLVKAGQPLDISNGWKRAFDFRGDFDPAVIRQRTIEKFNLEDCVHQYQEILERDI